MNDLKQILPRHKGDHEMVEKILALGYPKVKLIIPELLEWIQDMNWPIAQELAPFLASIGIDIIPEIEKIMQTDDYIWQYSCLNEIVKVIGKDAVNLLEIYLKRLVVNPTESEKEEYLHSIAAELLKIT